jgi:AsmA protein
VGAANGNDTLVQVASSDLRYAADGLRANNLNVVIPALGTLTGSGTVGADNSLNFNMVAKLAGSSALAQLVNLPLLNQKSGGGLPFHIEGTTEHPKVVPDIKGVAGILEKLAQPQGKTQQQQQPGGVIGGILNNLLNKKKTQQKQPQP